MLPNKQSIEGDGNILAGGSVNILDAQRLTERFGSRLSSIDKAIKEEIGQIRSPRSGNRLVQFSSEKLIMSLARIGIPILAAIEVAEGIQKQLSIVKPADGEVTTSHIRKAVSASIYSLDPSVYPSVATEGWADLYARRFGSPEERLKVIHRDGSEEDLSYRFLLKTLIPHLVQKILGVSYEEVKETILSETTVRKIAEEILEQVKGLSLYSIRYKTLFNLVYDIAVQPPHPWFVEQSLMSKTVQYDLERSKFHADRLEDLFGNKELGLCRHACKEAIHHACASILGFYGAFLGVSQLGPLNQLIQAIKIPDEDHNPFLWQFCRISQIDGDLRALGKTRSDLYLDLERLQHGAFVIANEKLPTLIRNAKKLASLAENLIIGRTNDIDSIIAQKTSLLFTDQAKLLNFSADVFQRVPGLSVPPELRLSNSYWIMHEIDSAVFRELRAKIAVVSIILSVDTDVQLIERSLQVGRQLVENESFSNTLFVVGNQPFSVSLQKSAKQVSDSSCRVFLLTANDVVDIFRASNRTEKLLRRLLNIQ